MKGELVRSLTEELGKERAKRTIMGTQMWKDWPQKLPCKGPDFNWIKLGRNLWTKAC